MAEHLNLTRIYKSSNKTGKSVSYTYSVSSLYVGDGRLSTAFTKWDRASIGACLNSPCTQEQFSPPVPLMKYRLTGTGPPTSLLIM